MHLSFSTNTIKFENTFNGKIRLAVLKDKSTASIYDQYKDTIPTSGAIDYSFTGDTATVTFDYTTESLTDAPANGDALMFALPHHVDVLQQPTYENIDFDTIKGQVRAVGGNTWTMREALTTIEWDAPRDYTRADWKEAVRSALAGDVSYKATAGDPYFFGT